MSFTFIQHLLENTPSSKEDLLEVNTEDFLNVLLTAAGEEPLREGELEGIPARMTVGALIDMYENRMPPPRMNYSFDEVDPDVDAKSFSRAGAARRKAERDDQMTRDSENDFERKAAQHSYDRRWGGDDEDRSSEHMMMHGTEEEEAKAPANRDKMKTIKREITTDLDHISNNSLPRKKRHRQQGGRLDKRLGLGWSEEEESRLPAAKIRAKRTYDDKKRSRDEFGNDAVPSLNRRMQRKNREQRKSWGG